jgi:hypothetical protein
MFANNTNSCGNGFLPYTNSFRTTELNWQINVGLTKLGRMQYFDRLKWAL